jgi:hypothetical protein
MVVRSFAGATIAAAVGVAGLMSGLAPVATGGFGLAAALTTAGLNALKDREELNTSDMFLLYNASKHAKR